MPLPTAKLSGSDLGTIEPSGKTLGRWEEDRLCGLTGLSMVIDRDSLRLHSVRTPNAVVPNAVAPGRNVVREKGVSTVFVAASTECYPSLSLADALQRLVDLEYTSVEIAIHEEGHQLKPSAVVADLDAAIDACRNTRRLDVIAYGVDISATGEEYYRQFQAICRVAKATKVVTLTVPSGELGTPFNEEVERLRRLVAIAYQDGIRVSIKSQVGRLSEDPDTVVVLCDNVEGLGLTLDPSHYICGPHRGKSLDKLYKYVYHVHLRDTTKDKLHVRVGQGEVEYGRLIGHLRQYNYTRALSVNMPELPDVDQMAEMRKMRLLLESLL